MTMLSVQLETKMHHRPTSLFLCLHPVIAVRNDLSLVIAWQFQRNVTPKTGDIALSMYSQTSRATASFFRTCLEIFAPLALTCRQDVATLGTGCQCTSCTHLRLVFLEVPVACASITWSCRIVAHPCSITRLMSWPPF